MKEGACVRDASVVVLRLVTERQGLVHEEERRGDGKETTSSALMVFENTFSLLAPRPGRSRPIARVHIILSNRTKKLCTKEALI